MQNGQFASSYFIVTKESKMPQTCMCAAPPAVLLDIFATESFRHRFTFHCFFRAVASPGRCGWLCPRRKNLRCRALWGPK